MNHLDEITRHNKELLASENGTPINIPSKKKARFRAGVGFASEYRFAMHTIGFQYIYFRLNQERDFFCERFYYPDKKYLKIHKKNRILLLTEETSTPLLEMGLLFFSLNYEGNYPKLFEMLRLIGLPSKSSERLEESPIYIAGGICPTYNPFPISQYFDAIIIGEAESVLPKLIKIYRSSKQSGKFTKMKFLARVSKLRGIYVPSFHTTGKVIRKAVVGCLENNFNGALISPLTLYQNQFYLELARGCGRGCKFCILGRSFLTPRVRSKRKILSISKKMSRFTKSIRLVTPSDSDHPQIVEIYKGLRKMGYIIDIGSQRADMLEARQEMFGYVRHSRLTIAPEAATEKLRRKIGKNISDEDIYKSVEIAAHQGFRRLQLFFIIGFPGETREDVMAISRMVKRARAILDEKDSSRTIIEVTVNSHIKKPHTEYEKLEQQDINTYFRYISKLKRLLATTHDVIVTHMERDLLSLECVLVRGLSKEGELIRKICEKKDSAEIRETDLKKMLKKGYYKYYRKLKDCIWKDIDLNP